MAEKKTITTKYGTKINVSGLTPEQIERVRSVAEDKGAYGTKGATLADELRKRNAAKQEATQPVTPPAPSAPTPSGPEVPPNQEDPKQYEPIPIKGEDSGVDKKTGVIDPNKAVPTVTGAIQDDTNKNFAMNNPGVQTDALGNTQQIVFDPVTGQTSINKTAGGALTSANNAFMGAANDFTQNSQSARLAAQDAAYNYITRDYASQKAREIDAAKQELSNRGIPIDAGNPNSLYSRTLSDIEKKYQGMDDQAKNQAITQGNQTYATNAGVVGTLGGTLQGQNPTFTAFQGGQSNIGEGLLNLISVMSDADLKKYGIDKDVELKKLAIRKSGSSGGGAADTSPVFAGNAPGFGV